MNVRDAIIDRDGLQALLSLLAERGYTVVGPTVRDDVIVYDEIHHLRDLPVGYTDRQDNGCYRLERRSDNALFGYVVGPQSWKKFLRPERRLLWSARREGEDITLSHDVPPPKYAFLGVRGCELSAINIHDKVFLNSGATDEDYAARRENNLVIAVNCGEAGGNCFCASMKTGPAVGDGFDLALTEILSPGPHRFLLQAGSATGAMLLSALPCEKVAEADREAARAATHRAEEGMGRRMDAEGARELLRNNPEHPHWDDVAARCLSCGNCTLVCPTCFCTTVEDANDLTGDNAARWQRWDSCFTGDFSYMHGGNVRSSTKSRYRQWMTHKLAHWIDQFGTSGCVGCGRCITWCPVGIDITAELAAMRTEDADDKKEKRS